MRQKFVYSIFLTLSFLLMAFVFPLHHANAAETVRVTIPVECPPKGQLPPALGSMIDVGATILFVPIDAANQKAVDVRALSKSAIPHTVYFYGLQWAGFNSSPTLTVNGCVLFATLYADQTTARELTWLVESQIPLRLIYTETF